MTDSSLIMEDYADTSKCEKVALAVQSLQMPDNKRFGSNEKLNKDMKAAFGQGIGMSGTTKVRGMVDKQRRTKNAQQQCIANKLASASRKVQIVSAVLCVLGEMSGCKSGREEDAESFLSNGPTPLAVPTRRRRCGEGQHIRAQQGAK